MVINRKALLAKIIVFLIIAIIGYFFYTRTLSNYRVTSSVTTGIVAGRYPYHDDEMKVNFFEIEVNTQKQTVRLSFGIAYHSKGNYSVLLTLPYRIASYENLRSGTWYVRNAVSGSVVMATFEAENVSDIGWSFQTLRTVLHTQDSIGDKIFETNSISLPFGGSITLDIQEKLDELREIVPISLFSDGFSGTLRLSLPYSAVITGTTQQIERRDPAQDFQVFEFRINEFKPFQLQYIDSAQRRDFETNLLLSGTIFGVAVSGFAGIVIELITTEYKNSDKKKSSNGTKMVNQSEGKKVEKTLTISYRAVAFLQKPVPFFVVALLINIMCIVTIVFGFRDIISVASSSALQVLASIVEASATILAIFFALVTFLFQQPSELRRTFSTGGFLSACVTFSASIIWGVNNMIIIEPDARVDGTVIFVPAYLLMASVFLLIIFFYFLFRRSGER